MAIDLDIIMIEDVVVEAGKEPYLVFGMGFLVVAIALERVDEGDDPFEAIARRAAEEQQRVEILVVLQLLEDAFNSL